MKYLLFIVLLVVVVITAGCISENKNTVVGPTQTTPAPAITIPTITNASTITTSIIPTITPIVTTTTSLEPIKTPTPKPDPTDVSEINFFHYSDDDFSVDYPSTWIITKSTYTPYYCKSVLDTSRNDYHVCFENETKSIGPFDFYPEDNLKKQSRIVTFTSADGKLKFVSFTTDFLDHMSGNWMLNPNVDWARSEFELRYPDLAASTYILNYKYFKNENMLTSTFDVKLPETSKYFPSAYAEKVIVTMHRANSYAFITDNENFDKYRNLKDRIISSIKPNDMI